jgi:hypothetical protein
MTLHKIWRILTFPLAYFRISTGTAGYYRISDAYRWHVIPEGVLILSAPEDYALMQTLNIRFGDLTDMREHIKERYNCGYCFLDLVENTCDTVLLFKSEEEKNWFLLKYG